MAHRCVRLISEAAASVGFAAEGEFSTWRGIAALAATGGVLVAPEQLDAAYKTFIAILGLAAVMSPAKRVA